jgi:hypothetical protein
MSDAETVKTIAKNCFTDAVEPLSIIEILEAANGNGVSKSLNNAKAGRAAAHIQRALFTRMHIIISRHFLPARKDDLTATRAFELMKDEKVKAAATTDAANMSKAEAEWRAGNADASLESYIHLRHKFLAHLAEPKPGVPVPMYKEVLDIARNAAKCFGTLAKATGIVTLDIETQIPAQKESAAAFWKPSIPK